MTRVVHCKIEPYDILIDRTTKYGNPFIIGKDGDRNEVIEKFERYARNHFTREELLALEDHVLGCWCKTENNPMQCHGDVYVKLIKEIMNGEPIMGQERMNAMEEERKNPYGKPTWLYVDQDKLDRLGIKYYRAAVGDNTIRIIPPLDPRTPWAKRVHLHKDIGANKKTFLCLKRMFNQPCPICEHADRREGEGAKTDELKAFWPKSRDLIFVVDLTNEVEEKKGLRWWDAPCDDDHAIKENIFILSKDPVTNKPIDVSDPEFGRDIRFTRKGSDRNTSYMGFQLIDNGAIPEEWYKNVPKFEDILLISTYEEMSTELYGVAAEGGAAADEQMTAPDTGRASAQPEQTQTRTPAPAATATATTTAQAPVNSPPTQAQAQAQAQPTQTATPTNQPRTRRSYGAGSAASPAADGNKPSVDQRIADIRQRKAERAGGNGGGPA